MHNRDFMQRKAAEEYTEGKITLSEAAHRASLTLWKMEKYLVEKGFKSSYSIEDLNRELKALTLVLDIICLEHHFPEM